MASVKILSSEMDGKQFPLLCMRCGAPAKTFALRRFTAYPKGEVQGDDPYFNHPYTEYWVPLPVCGWHRHMWTIKNGMIALAILTPVLCLVGLLILEYIAGNPGQPGEPSSMRGVIISLHTAAIVFCLMLALIAIFSWRNIAIRALRGNEDWVMLSGVSPKFIAAWKSDETTPIRAKNLAPAQDSRVSETSELERPSQRKPSPSDPDLRTKLRVWGVVCLGLGILAVVLPRFGWQIEAFTLFGSIAPYIGAGVAVLGGILLVVAANMRDQDKREDDQQAGR